MKLFLLTVFAVMLLVSHPPPVYSERNSNEPQPTAYEIMRQRQITIRQNAGGGTKLKRLKKDWRLTLRIPTAYAKAAHRYALEYDINFNELIMVLIKEGIPEQYWHGPEKE